MSSMVGDPEGLWTQARWGQVLVLPLWLGVQVELLLPKPQGCDEPSQGMGGFGWTVCLA